MEGQVKGVQAMVENERDCTDIVMQIAAIRAALDAVAQLIVKDYAMSCVDEISSENGSEKIEKLMKLLFKYL